VVDAALGGTIPDSVIRPVMQEWLRTDPKLARYGLRWWYQTRDSASLESVLAMASEAIDRRGDDRQALYDREAAAAYLALLRSDTTSAIHHFLALSNSPCEACSRDRMVYAELAAATGDSNATTALTRRPPGLLNPAEIPQFAELGRLFEKAGKRNEARYAYQAVADAWRNGDMTARSAAAAARAAAVRLR